MGGNENNLALGATFNAMKMDDTTCQRPCSSPKFRGIHMLQSGLVTGGLFLLCLEKRVELFVFWVISVNKPHICLDVQKY